jgi:hypothetical protein
MKPDPAMRDKAEGDRDTVSPDAMARESVSESREADAQHPRARRAATVHGRESEAHERPGP